jgi:hypothetical protein
MVPSKYLGKMQVKKHGKGPNSFTYGSGGIGWGVVMAESINQYWLHAIRECLYLKTMYKGEPVIGHQKFEVLQIDGRVYFV